jgi:spermidine synthase
VLHTDAREYLASSKESFDVIIIDLPEPIEKGPAYLLYTQEFYRLVRDRLTGQGLISVQSGSASWTELENLRAVMRTLRSVFPVVCAYQVDIPSFGGPWGFCQASASLSAAELSAAEVDQRILARGLSGLKFYDGLSHQCMFSLPKHLREELAAPAHLITDDSPLFMYKT